VEQTETHCRTTTTTVLQPLSGTTRVSRYQKKHSLTHASYPDHQPSFISFLLLHPLRSIATSVFNFRKLTTHIRLKAFFQDNLGKPVPER